MARERLRQFLIFKLQGLPVSGVIDESTASALQAADPKLGQKVNAEMARQAQVRQSSSQKVTSAPAVNALPRTAPSRAAPSTGGRTYLFGKGDQGPDVALYSDKTEKAGFLSDKADGIYGDNTVKAVSAFPEKTGTSGNRKCGRQNLICS